MKSIRLAWAILPAAFIGFSPRALPAPFLYSGVAGYSPENPGALLVSDMAVQLTTVIGNPDALPDLSGLAFSPQNFLYGVVTLASSSQIGRLDPATGAVIGSLVPIQDASGSLAIDDIAYQPNTGVLFGITAGPSPGGAGLLYRIDPLSGSAFLVGDTTTASGGGLAFGIDGTLFFAPGDVAGFSFLDQLNPNDATVLSSVELTQPYVALAVVPSTGELIGAIYGFDGIWTIDPFLGFETLDFLTAHGEPGALTFAAVPEPGSLAGFGLAILLAWRWRSDRRRQ